MKFLFLLMIVGFVGCAQLFPYRSFEEEMNASSDGVYDAGTDFYTVGGDQGRTDRTTDEIAARTPHSPNEIELNRQKKSLQVELMQKEKALSEQEYREYAQAKSFLGDTSERIYYLDLPQNERSYYLLNRRSLGKDESQGRLESSRMRNEILNSFEMPEIYLGMDKDMVVRSWGEPDRVDVAGDPRHENERWQFYRNGKLQYIYFERGKIQGWSL
jgi:hypothetical protein